MRLDAINTKYNINQLDEDRIEDLLYYFANLAMENGLDIESCAESIDLEHLGIKHGKCVDDELIKNEFGIYKNYKKDKSQRLVCGCTESKDIGMNNTCLMGCEYCYATFSNERAIENKKNHDPEFPSLIKHELTQETREKIKSFKENLFRESSQISLKL